MIGKIRQPMEYVGNGMWWCPSCGILYDQREDEWVKPKPPEKIKIKFHTGVSRWIKNLKVLKRLTKK
jgi:hypothetical protein